MREVPSTSVDPTHPEVLRTTKRIHQKRTRANQPYHNFIEEQKRKREQQKTKQQTTKATKISHKTLNKILKQQQTEDAKQRAVKIQQHIHAKGVDAHKQARTKENKENSPIPITQDDDDEDTVAPIVSPYPEDEFEGEEEPPVRLRRSPRFQSVNFMCQAPASISQQALQAFTANAFLQELQWKMQKMMPP